MKQAMCSKLLAFQNLAGEVQSLLHTGGIDMEKAYLLSQVPDVAAQVELLKSSAHLSREQVRAKVKGNGKAKPTSRRSVFVLPSGMNVTVCGRESDLEGVIEGLQELVKELKRGLSQGNDIVSFQRILKNKAKVSA